MIPFRLSPLRRPLSALVLVCLLPVAARTQQAAVSESLWTFRTYPFSDPDPVPRITNIYPYFRFQGYTALPAERRFRIVTLENPYIRVLVAPEIGGKVLGAFEKHTGRAFIYFNRVVKFREIAMRGPWTSGGIEFNFGDIGHAPTTATPVDYTTRRNADGSVSCIVGTLDLPSRTEWRVEIRLPPDRALFETRTFWYNPTAVSTSLYHWMNAAADADSTLQFVYPGTAYIGHAGEHASWPLNAAGRDLSWYRNNDFGSYKSYHVLGRYTDYFGARWGDLGFLHWSRYSDKPGKKLWIWGLSRQGEIWKGLLTDSALGNTQYVELQSGLLFNQALPQSSRTPFKHMWFPPNSSERFMESWFPFRGLAGVTRATPGGALEVRREGRRLHLAFSPTGAFHDTVLVQSAGRTVLRTVPSLGPLETYRDSALIDGGACEVVIGKVMRYRPEEDSLMVLERPVAADDGYDWQSADGLASEGDERARQRDYEGALEVYRAALAKSPALIHALNGAADCYYRRLETDSALVCARKALAIDAYDPEANYLYGLIERRRGRLFDARDGLGFAARSSALRPAALRELAEVAFLQREQEEAEEYARRVLETDQTNIPARMILAAARRLAGDSAGAMKVLSEIDGIDPLNHFARFERTRLGAFPAGEFPGGVRNELPHETFLELASFYVRLGLWQDAGAVLHMAPAQPLVALWRARIADTLGMRAEADSLLVQALGMSPRFVFPYRPETFDVLSWAAGRSSHWKLDYYRALLLWSLGRRAEAARLFTACGDRPADAPFYLARASFFAADTARALADARRALALEPGEWRCYQALAGLLNDAGRSREAASVCREGSRRFPGSYVLSFLLARTLLLAGDHASSLAIMDTLTILPFEGAQYGHDVYRQACLMNALEQLRAKQYERARALVAKARLWPERLGAGKPYLPDTRLEDYTEAAILRAERRKTEAMRLLAAIGDVSLRLRENAGPQDLLGALALRALQRGAEARRLLERWRNSGGSTEGSQWGDLIYRGDFRKAAALQERFRNGAFSRTSGAPELALVADVLQTLHRVSEAAP